ncbi:hypothetical protein [Vibrio crassostreae]|uniref:hypothetical protein n=1 Tax=Vibrio crassostreae TaxID=246167 RepID=UPI001B30518E|nr:hypothetical protein [Vibrio crassostreae]
MFENLTVRGTSSDLSLHYREMCGGLHISKVYAVSLAEQGVESGARKLLSQLRERQIKHPNRYSGSWLTEISDDQFVGAIKKHHRISAGLEAVKPHNPFEHLEYHQSLFGLKGVKLCVRGDKVSIAYVSKTSSTRSFSIMVTSYGMDRSLAMFKSKYIEVHDKECSKSLSDYLSKKVSKLQLMECADSKDALDLVSDASIILRDFFHADKSTPFNTIGVQFIKIRNVLFLQYKREATKGLINEYFRIKVNWSNPEHSISEFINRVSNTIGDYVGSAMRVEVRHRLESDITVSKLYERLY